MAKIGRNVYIMTYLKCHLWNNSSLSDECAILTFLEENQPCRIIVMDFSFSSEVTPIVPIIVHTLLDAHKAL